MTRATLTKLGRYFCTAGVAAIVDAGGFALLTGLGHMPVPPSASLSFAVAAVANYLLSSRFAFHARPSWAGLARFLIGALGGFAINVGVTVACSSMLGLPAMLAKLVGIGIAFLANFAINLRFVFRPPNG